MKKLFTTLVILGSMIGLSHAALIDDAVSWMNSEGLTIFDNTTDYKPNNMIRRDEAAKLFVMFAKSLGVNDYVKSDSECTFDDLGLGHQNLKQIIVESCKLSLFEGYNKTLFRPTWNITAEHVLIVLNRILIRADSHIMNFQGTCGAVNKYDYMINEASYTKQVTRGEIATYLYDLYHWKNDMIEWDNSNCYGM